MSLLCEAGANKRLVFCCLAIVVILASPSRCAVPQTVDTQPEPAVLNLKISSDRLTYVQGDDIRIQIQLQNISRRDIFVGRDLWTNASPSHVTLSVIPINGHKLGGGLVGFVDGIPAHAWDDFPKALLAWGFLLPPGYSFGTTTLLPGAAEFAPGIYKVRAIYSSFGIDTRAHINPLLTNPAELANLMPFSWQGEANSNELRIKIVKRAAKK
jgi:hypothetical protein